MKKAWLILILALSAGSKIQAQSSFIFAGGSFHPDQITETGNYLNQEPVIDYSKEVKWHPGFSFHAGFGKSINLSDRLSLKGTWQVQYQEYTSDGQYRESERNEPKDLISEGVFKTSLQHSSWQISLLLEKEFTLMKQNWRMAGGGYVGFQLEDWTKDEVAGTRYFDIMVDHVFDSICQCSKEIIISKEQFDPPYFYEGKSEYDSRGIRPLNFGLTGGISFPLLSSKEGNLRGRVSVSQDLKTYFDDGRPNFHQTSITAGLMFEPVKIRRLHLRKPEKRTLSSGIYSGVSLHVIFVSLDGMWLSSKNVGIDVAARYCPIRAGRSPSSEVYTGAVYRFGNSRFFAKMGGAYTWIQDMEYYDETRFSFVLGGKYVLPFSNFMGMQVNAGWMMSKGEKPWPELGIGLLFLPN